MCPRLALLRRHRSQMLRFLTLIAVSGVLPMWAAEVVVFKSGTRMQADRHERDGEVVRLYQGGGVSEVPAQVIAGFEFIEDAPPAEPTAIAESLQPSVTAAPASQSQVSNDPMELIRAAAIREGLPPEFVASVAKVESALRANAVSPKGAIGIMQLMPATAQALGADPHDVRQNIDAGTRLLRELLIKYDGDVVKALSAYNAGSGAVDRYKGLPPYDETRRYVNKVIGAYQQSHQETRPVD